MSRVGAPHSLLEDIEGRLAAVTKTARDHHIVYSAILTTEGAEALARRGSPLRRSRNQVRSAFHAALRSRREV
ncbi:MAG: hypothetical protein AB1486_00870 [Planctomycetota bacterium]